MINNKSTARKKYIDSLLLISAIISLLSLLSIIIVEKSFYDVFIVIDALTAILFFFLFLYRKKISSEIKAYFLIVIAVLITTYSIINNDTNSTAIPIMASYIVFAYVFLDKSKSRIIAYGSIFLLIIMAVLVKFQLININLEPAQSAQFFTYWLYQFLAMILFVVASGRAIIILKTELYQIIRELKLQNNRLIDQAYTDPLTGLGNQLKIRDTVNQRIFMEVTTGKLLLFNIKNFRSINSIYSTDYGNSILKTIGKLLKSYEDDNVVAARLGDDEFCLWVEGETIEIINRYIDEFSRNLKNKINELETNVSVLFYRAVANYPENGKNYDELYAKSSIAMTYARDKSIFALQSYTVGMEEQYTRNNQYSVLLHSALDNDKFTVNYQKKYDVSGEHITGVEALVRWSPDGIGPITPEVFIPVIHDSNLMIPFTIYMVKKVLADYLEIHKRVGKEIPISINIPPCFFLSSSFINTVRNLIGRFKINPEMIIFEITEDIFIEDTEIINSIVDELTELGIKVALDDFGKGYSSLSYIRNIKFHELKIDKSFVDDISTNDQSFELFKSICTIAEVYDCKVVAEGVEKKEQVDRIRETNCNMIQGFYYAKPVPLENL